MFQVPSTVSTPATRFRTVRVIPFAVSKSTRASYRLLESEYRWMTDTANGITLTVRKRVAGVENVLGTWNTDWTHVAGSYVWVRFWVSGTTLKAKIWQDGKVEPDTWQIVATDSALATGQIGVKSVRNAGNTNANADIRFGQFSFQDAQAISVVRSWNYVVKSQAAGEPIEVFHEATLAI